MGNRNLYRALLFSIAAVLLSGSAMAQQNGTFKKVTITDSLKLRGIAIRDIKLNFTSPSHYNLPTQKAVWDLVQANKNHVWTITNLSDTTSVTGEIEGDIAYVSSGDTLAIRDTLHWLVFTGGGGGGGTFTSFNVAADSGTPAEIEDGETVTFIGGAGITTVISGNNVTNNLDNTAVVAGSYGSASQVAIFTVGADGRLTATANVSILIGMNQVTGLNDSIAAAPSGTGTNNYLTKWTGTNSQGNSFLSQDAVSVMMDANKQFELTGGTTANRPTGVKSAIYYNTSNNWFDLHNGTSWFNPARSATTNGLFTAGSVLFGHSDGTIQQDNTGIFFNSATDGLGLGTAGNISIGEFGGQFTVQGSLPIITSYRPSSVGGQGTGYQIVMNSATSVPTTLAYFNGYMITNTAGAVSGGLAFFTRNAGSLTTKMNILGSGEVGIGTTSPDRLFHTELSDAVTNAISFVGRFSHITSGTAAAGSGAGIEFEAESAGGTNRVAGTIENPYTTATNAAEVSDLVFRTMRAGTLTESLRSLGNGTLQIGTLSGTVTQLGGYTAGNIASTWTTSYGLTFASGVMRVDTASANGLVTQSDLAASAASSNGIISALPAGNVTISTTNDLILSSGTSSVSHDNTQSYYVTASNEMIVTASGLEYTGTDLWIESSNAITLTSNSDDITFNSDNLIYANSTALGVTNNNSAIGGTVRLYEATANGGNFEIGRASCRERVSSPV